MVREQGAGTSWEQREQGSRGESPRTTTRLQGARTPRQPLSPPCTTCYK
ncbi:hypothetical protein H6G17_02285 [Chroococcidiopsis sp. FACHB-1243]|nr:hypothetical protein [Chroococcidiopsis sp. [FACHB-1243]]MBD2304350.1 hypothetical protein [Chroococcidiopsis sp. [FACHB-1243]]